MIHEVIPYVPNPELVAAAPGAQGPGALVWRPLNFTRALSCAGDFADPLLNSELRRFLVRDILPFVISAVGFLILTLAFAVQLPDPDVMPPVLFYAAIVLLGIYGLLAALDLVSVVIGAKNRTAAIRIHFIVSCALGLAAGTELALTPATSVVFCGVSDLSVVNGSATNGDAIALRQRYCFDYVSPWLTCYVFSLFVMRRYYPQHGVPLLGIMLGGYVLGVGLRPRSTPDAPYSVNAGSVASDVAMQVSVVAVVTVFCTRFHALGRERFMATVNAERARHLSTAEMRAMDVLLQRALPPTVLHRMVAAGVEIRDAVDSAAVGIAGVVGFASFLQLAGELEAVAALHALFVAVDELATHHPGVEKIKTAGDRYFVAAGLPEAFNCHASATCRFGRALIAAAAELGAASDTTAAAAADDDAATQIEPAHLRGWRSGALRLCFGVNCGPAFGSVLGTQRLSYEVYGDAYDGAELALRHAAPTQIAITDAARRRLAVEASLYAADVDSAALFATPDGVNEATEHLDAVDGGATVLFALAPVESTIGNALREALARHTARADDAGTVCTHSVATGFTGAGSAVGQWTAGRMQEQRGELEQRLEFILRLEEARRVRGKLQYKGAHHSQAMTGSPHAPEAARPIGEAPAHAAVAESGNGDAPLTAADREGTTLLALMEDAVNGPFKRGTRVPLLYSFADAEEEHGYAEWIQQASHELRRDMRIGTLLLYAVVLASYLFTGTAADKSMASLGCFIVSLALGIANASITALRKAPRSDVPLANAAYFCMAAGVFIGNSNSSRSHVITNDVWWLLPFHLVMVDSAALTLTPLARFAIETPMNIAVLLPGISREERSDEFPAQAVFGLLGVLSLPYMWYLFDKLLRRAFIETRVAALMRQQQDDARRAREVMLLGIVPAHAVRPLQQWLNDDPGATPEAALTETFSAKVVCHMSLRGFTQTEEGGPGLSLLDAHRAVDAILDSCPTLSKVRMSGHAVTLAGPFPARPPRFRDDSSSNILRSPAEMDDDLAGALSDTLGVVSAVGQVGIVVHAGIDVGPVAGGVVGCRRFSYDVYGTCVQSAQHVADALLGTEGTTDVGTDAVVKVALTDSACSFGATSSPRQRSPAGAAAESSSFTLPSRSTLAGTETHSFSQPDVRTSSGSAHDASCPSAREGRTPRLCVTTRRLDMCSAPGLPSVAARIVTGIETGAQ